MLLYDVHKAKDRGFTLVEMITTIIILGVLAAVAAPNLLGMLNKSRVKDGLGQVESAIRESQKLAIRRGRPCTIDFTTNGAGNSVVSTATQGCLLNSRELPDNVSFGAPSSITFSAKGNPTIVGSTTANVSETIVISHSKVSNSKCIQIEGLLGNIITGDYDSNTSTCNVQ